MTNRLFLAVIASVAMAGGAVAQTTYRTAPPAPAAPSTQYEQGTDQYGWEYGSQFDERAPGRNYDGRASMDAPARPDRGA